VTERTLVVDDDPLIRRTVERILTRAGYEVVTATNVQEAERYANRLQFDAALVDYDLATENGLTVLARLRDLQPSCLRILMTGHTDFPMVVEAVNRGEVLRVIRKPFDPAGLIQTLTDAFRSMKRMAEVATAQQQAAEFQERQMLEECFKENLLRLAVQPIVKAHNSDVVAYEALLRSSHSILKGPLSVLQVADRNNRLVDVGAKVFELASSWVPQIPEPIGLFVNISPEQLADAERLHKDLSPLHHIADRITVEITEQSNLHAIAGWDESIQMLAENGFSVAVDDLGAGYNSLKILADLQPRYIKMDMSLVRNINTEPRKQRLVQLISTFAEATNSISIAEGVETEDERKALIDCGTDLLQGYFFAKPSTDQPVKSGREKRIRTIT
jgi:EAL domain-containing protein (putative c-di-GMP-specific phosphodiesterase class I)